ncbi:hypothetical protein [Pedobacter arcticus]|uniref:hypothetical protein n=1 Tax=Pedobacter arcticus TaxID=752140 RepID=UPI00031FB1D8|nr:hypothetical protein [Pedobacter arcticus]
MKDKIIYLIILLIVCFDCVGQVNPNYHYVKGHIRADGIYVRGYYKTNNNQTNRDNYSTKPNINPWTGEAGYIEPDVYYSESYSSTNKSEYLSEDFNKAIELNDNKNYVESIKICKEVIKKYNKAIFTTELLGWNYLAINEKKLALEAFKFNYEKNSKLSFSASILYLAYLINNEPLKAKELKSSLKDGLNSFNGNLIENIRKYNLMIGIPNLEILKLILDNENLYLDQNLLVASGQCSNCKIEFISNNIIDVGEKFLKKRFILEDGIESNCVSVEIECPIEFRESIKNVLSELNFSEKRYIQKPVLRKKGDLREKSITSELYIREKNNKLSGVIICDLDLDGELNKSFFTIMIRK